MLAKGIEFVFLLLQLNIHPRCDEFENIGELKYWLIDCLLINVQRAVFQLHSVREQVQHYRNKEGQLLVTATVKT